MSGKEEKEGNIVLYIKLFRDMIGGGREEVEGEEGRRREENYVGGRRRGALDQESRYHRYHRYRSNPFYVLSMMEGIIK